MPNKEISIYSVDSAESEMECIYEEPTVCPMCHHALVPQPLQGYFVKQENKFVGYDEIFGVYILFLCPRCRRVFLVEYTACFHPGDSTKLSTSQICGIYPRVADSAAFHQSVNELSPMFVITYNQSEAAEAQQLTEVAGCGYRKALEYLVKDYLSHKFPQEGEDIKVEFLGVSIKRIEDNRIKTLVERATWIGNDATHYVKKHENLDIQDMKKFINAMLHYIISELSFEDALEIPFKK